MKNIVLFGTGGLASFLVRHIKKDIRIIAYIDSFDTGRNVDGVPVISLEEVEKIEYDYIIIAFSDVVRGKEMLLEKGVDSEKIIAYHYNGAYNYADNPFQIEFDRILCNEIHTKDVASVFDLPEKKYYLCSMNIPDERSVIERDFVREQTVALVANEIKRKNVQGEVAELGVFKGEFSKKLNKLFPERKLYLFDTFEGFAEDDVNRDSSINWGCKNERFKDTRVDAVLERMPYKEKCVVKKGYFPETFDLDDKWFALVSIDADLYAPIKSGLELFYPRLSPGGYIMVHDYNNIIYQGATRAVQDYCDENDISIVPIPDMAGTVIITK